MKTIAITIFVPILMLASGLWVLWVSHDASAFVRQHAAEDIAMAFLSDDTEPIAAFPLQTYRSRQVVVADVTLYTNHSDQLVGQVRLSGVQRSTVGLAILASKSCSLDQRLVFMDPNPHPRPEWGDRQMGDFGEVSLHGSFPATAIVIQDAPDTPMFTQWNQVQGHAFVVLRGSPAKATSLVEDGIACGLIGVAEPPGVAH